MGSIPLLSAWTTHPPLALIVDQDRDTRMLYADCLKLSSCDVEEAEDGREALAKAISRQPDVIVTATRLPGIDGFDLCELLRHDTTTCNIPIVCVTGDAAQTTGAENAGADTVLVKPCLPERILAEVHRLLDESAELRERSRQVRAKVSAQIARSEKQRTRASQVIHRNILSRSFQRLETKEPAAVPPASICSTCDSALLYLRSYIGGVSARHPEQWDYFECANGCGTFQYRQRTHKLRKVSG